MLIKRPSDIKPSEITDPGIYARRREFLKGAAAIGIGGLIGGPASALVKPAGKGTPIAGVIESPYGRDLELTSYEHATTYNNFYEFGTDKTDPARKCRHACRHDPGR